MEWITIELNNNGKIDTDTLPYKPGKYVIETKTGMGNINRFESYFDGHKFHFSNQTLVRWLEE